MKHQLAQANVARMRAPLDDPLMQRFVDQLDEINALAESSPGFVWRLQTEEGNATAVRVLDDDRLLLNMSVWVSLDALKRYVYDSDHLRVMRDRSAWFERMEGPFLVLWWVPAGHRPTPAEAEQRLRQLRALGPTAEAFTFKQPYPAPILAGE